MPTVAAVILAAGSSTRFGSPKQLARIGERSMLECVTQVAGDAGLAPIVVVVPNGITAPGGTLAVVNDRPQDGLSRSLKMGIGAVPGGAEAAVVLLGDQPTLPVTTIERLLGQLTDGPPVAVTRANGRIGPPVLLRREAFHLVAEAVGDQGLATVLHRHPRLVAHVDVPTHAPDVDTPADLAGLVEVPTSAGG